MKMMYYQYQMELDSFQSEVFYCLFPDLVHSDNVGCQKKSSLDNTDRRWMADDLFDNLELTEK